MDDLSKITLMQGDCLERMKEIESGSVEMILTDPPYGTVRNAGLDGWENKKTDWDVCLDHGKMLEECNRILRTNGALVLFCQDPYTAKLMTETHGNLPFSYRMTWLKDHFANSLIAKKAPVNYTEDICVFFKKYDTLSQHPLREYSEYLRLKCEYSRSRFFKEFGSGFLQHFMEGNKESSQFGLCTEHAYSKLIEMYGIDKLESFKPYAELVEIDITFKSTFKRTFNLPEGKKYKSNVLSYKKDYSGFHPTQKPVALLEDLIKTYTNEGDTVLDFTAGSMSTAIACINTNRKGVMIEKDEHYFKVGSERVERALLERALLERGD